MARPRSLDTNCLLRWILQDIPEQAEAVSRLLGGGHAFYVSDLALTEFVYVLEKLYSYPRSMIADNLLAIATHPNIRCSKSLLDGALPPYVHYPSVSFTDCCLAVEAELTGAAPLLTFDRALAKKLQHTELVPA